jgi:hypothetical protein
MPVTIIGSMLTMVSMIIITVANKRCRRSAVSLDRGILSKPAIYAYPSMCPLATLSTIMGVDPRMRINEFDQAFQHANRIIHRRAAQHQRREGAMW